MPYTPAMCALLLETARLYETTPEAVEASDMLQMSDDDYTDLQLDAANTAECKPC